MVYVIFQGLLQALIHRDFGRPADELVDLAKVGLIISDGDGFPLVGKRNQLVVPAAADLHQQGCQFLETDLFVVAKIKYLTVGLATGSSSEERFDYIGDEIEISPLFPVAEDLKRLSFH